MRADARSTGPAEPRLRCSMMDGAQCTVYAVCEVCGFKLNETPAHRRPNKMMLYMYAAWDRPYKLRSSCLLTHVPTSSSFNLVTATSQS